MNIKMKRKYFTATTIQIGSRGDASFGRVNQMFVSSSRVQNHHVALYH